MAQIRQEATAEACRNYRLPGQLARVEETENQSLARRQREFEERNERQPANKKACNASQIFNGEQMVKEHYIGSRTTSRGGYTNKCQFCHAIRFPQEKETICCQK